jgi:hypothetical protein
MTRDDVIRVLQTIIVMYPSSKVNADPLTVAMWHEMLEDLPADVVSVAMKRMCATLKYPPSVADIREAVKDAVQDAAGIPIAGEAWARVSKAMSRWGYHRPEQARADLGEDIWRAVEMIGGWCEVCMGERAVLSAQFERRYNAMVEQRSKLLQIPASVREDMARLAEPLAKVLMLGGGETGC